MEDVIGWTYTKDIQGSLWFMTNALTKVHLAKRSLEQETDMTDALVEQGERKRCKEFPIVPESADSSNSSESSTDTEMGLMDVCTILYENPETGCRRGGPVTLALTMWDFNKADCRTKCRKLTENSKPHLLIGSPIDCGGVDREQSRAVLHLTFVCELYEIQVRT